VRDNSGASASVSQASFDKAKKSDLPCWHSKPRQFRKHSGANIEQGDPRNLTIRRGLLTMPRRTPAVSVEIARSTE